LEGTKKAIGRETLGKKKTKRVTLSKEEGGGELGGGKREEGLGGERGGKGTMARYELDREELRSGEKKEMGGGADNGGGWRGRR